MKTESTFCGTWASSQYSSEANMPEISLEKTTLRQIVRISVKGDSFRFHFSNFLGESEVEIKEAHVAYSESQGSGKIIKDTDTIITFNGNKETVIPAKGNLTSDTISFSAAPLQELAVTVYLGKVPALVSGHVGSRTNTFIEKGNHCSAETIDDSYKTLHWYFLSEIDVVNTDNNKAVVCLGDSITDGRGTTNDKQDRWTDIFAERLQKNPATKNIAVLNQGIGGTCVRGAGLNPQWPTGESRFQKDVLAQTNAKYLVMLYGINDIIAGTSAEDIIETYKNLIKKAHENGMTAYGGTILPFGKNSGWTEEKEAVRNTVNKWIKNAPNGKDGFDGFIDFASVMGDEENPLYLNTKWNFEDDGLHPNAIGYLAMGNVVDLNLFTK